ncbi:uncharacterized protein DUF481 [Pontibacter ummariensis]|uniref:DUF481 domain-containing protein n=1 Tax=Pontibacter ummariensis TaxID=1610492 RepID=A0A239BM67_9BACT|nr:DUF481 domain-containing protein [Pontibacter ummariensis]PRY15782.1 uncharacterized protein DUF481 [Pontibacter ummariensis]SNS08491.1 Protein of unknown function, DUF481 [Pontibacter ummariensis]
MQHALRRFLLLTLLTLSIGLFQPLQAQILNIERFRPPKDSINYLTGKAGLSFSMFNRNAGKDNPNNYLQLTFNGDLAYISARHSYLLLNYYNYLLINYDSDELRNVVASTGYSHFRVNFFRNRRLSYEAFVQAQTDKARGLELRTLVGGGLRYALRKGKESTIYVGTGLMHEHEEWELPDREEVIVVSDLLKSTNYFSMKTKFNEHVSTEGIVYYQVGYDQDLEELRNRVSGDISLVVKLTNKFSLVTSFSCIYEDEPIVPVTNFVYTISNGVQVSF